MVVHLKAISADGEKTTFQVFVNGELAGTMVLSQSNATYFHDLVIHSCYRVTGDVIYSSGRWVKE